MAIRLVVLAQLADHPVLQPAGSLDDAVYVQLARRVATGDVLLAPDAFFLPPFYTYFLGGVFALFDESILGARVAQALLGGAATVLIYDTTRRWFGLRAALASGLLAAGTGLFAFNEMLLLQSALDPFLTALALWSFSRALAGGTAASFAGAGAAFAALCLNRPNALLPALLLPGVWLALRHSTAAVRQVVAFALGLLVLIGPVAIRNRAVGGEWVPITSHGGLNFYIGNGPGADGRWRRIPGVRDDINGQVEDARRVAGAALGRPVGSGEASWYFSRLAWTWIRTDPTAALSLWARKAALVFTATDVPLNYSYAYFAREEDTALRVLVVGPWLLVPLGLFGLVVGGLQRRDPGYLAWASFAPAYALTLVAFFVASRYRLSLLVPLVTGTAGALTWLWNAWTASPRRILAFAAPPLIALVVLVNWPLGIDDGRAVEREGVIVRLFAEGLVTEGVQRLEAAEAQKAVSARLLCRVGLALRERNDAAGALAYIDQASQRDPGDRWVRFHRGETLLELRRLPEALDELEKARGAPGIPAAEIVADIAGAHHLLGHAEKARAELEAAAAIETLSDYDVRHLGELALQLGAYDAAERFLRAHAGRAPDDAVTHELLGTALGATGRLEDAARELERAIHLDPSSVSARVALAAALAQAGRLDDARGRLVEALQLRPGDPEAQALLERLPRPAQRR